jgi:acylpyruvate hydrolase
LKLLTFSNEGVTTFGAKIEEYYVDLGALIAKTCGSVATESFPRTLKAFLEGGEPAFLLAKKAIDSAIGNDVLAELREQYCAYTEDEIVFLPPIPNPSKIVCLGMNYRAHVKEMGRELPKFPTIFAKFSNVLIGHKSSIVLPSVSNMVDYEAEMAIVIGRRAKNVKPEDAFQYIAGYTVFNDVSVRDYQNRTLQWLQGKSFDGTGPIGPALVTIDEVPNGGQLDISLSLNGEVMQQSNTSDFIFDIPTIISYISQVMTLEPGDIIPTGTPSGVGAARNPPVFLKPGDRIKVELGGVGVLENDVVKPA